MLCRFRKSRGEREGGGGEERRERTKYLSSTIWEEVLGRGVGVPKARPDGVVLTVYKVYKSNSCKGSCRSAQFLNFYIYIIYSKCQAFPPCRSPVVLNYKIIKGLNYNRESVYSYICEYTVCGVRGMGRIRG